MEYMNLRKKSMAKTVAPTGYMRLMSIVYLFIHNVIRIKFSFKDWVLLICKLVISEYVMEPTAIVAFGHAMSMAFAVVMTFRVIDWRNTMCL